MNEQSNSGVGRLGENAFQPGNSVFVYRRCASQHRQAKAARSHLVV